MANEARFEVYPQMHDTGPDDCERLTPSGEYGWHFRAADGQITAIGGEGFTRREDAHRAIGAFLNGLFDAAYMGSESLESEYLPTGQRVNILDIDE